MRVLLAKFSKIDEPSGMVRLRELDAPYTADAGTAIAPARKFLMLRILTRSVSEGYTPGPSLTLRVSMTSLLPG